MRQGSGPRVGRRPSTTQDHITDVALALFAAHGFDEVSVDEDTGEVTVSTTVIDEVVTDEPADEGASSGPATSDDLSSQPVEVDLRDASPNGSDGRVGSEVPVAPAPEEGTANRAVLLAGVGAAGLLAIVLGLLLRRRRRTD